jgi:asparagine synthetase B (glutamine-hydrolysing)
MERRGEDPPTDEDIDYFGLYQACKNTRGDFAIFSRDGSLAARGRTGTTPLYWNHNKRLFSFWPNDEEGFEEFPEGYLYNAKHDRVVCWDPMYYDKPLGVTIDEAVASIEGLLKEAIQFRIDKCDAFLLSSNDGSILIDSFLEPGTIDAYTVFQSDVPGVEFIENQNRTMVFVDEENTMYELAKFLKKETSHTKFLCGLGCKELFRDCENEDFFVFLRLVNEFAKFDLEVYSPFLDAHVMEYVLDMTKPDMRPRILYRLLCGKKY